MPSPRSRCAHAARPQIHRQHPATEARDAAHVRPTVHRRRLRGIRLTQGARLRSTLFVAQGNQERCHVLAMPVDLRKCRTGALGAEAPRGQLELDVVRRRFPSTQPFSPTPSPSMLLHRAPTHVVVACEEERGRRGVSAARGLLRLEMACRESVSSNRGPSKPGASGGTASTRVSFQLKVGPMSGTRNPHAVARANAPEHAGGCAAPGSGTAQNAENARDLSKKRVAPCHGGVATTYRDFTARFSPNSRARWCGAPGGSPHDPSPRRRSIGG